MPPQRLQDQTSERPASVLLQVSNTMVRLFKEQFGRGPTAARTHWAGPDVLLTVLDDTLTSSEKNLIRLGEHKLLRDTRSIFQYSSVAEFVGPVEEITGRTVRAFHSSTDTEVDGQSVEVFVFYPEGAEGPSRKLTADIGQTG